jgi:hypothetical protein
MTTNSFCTFFLFNQPSNTINLNIPDLKVFYSREYRMTSVNWLRFNTIFMVATSKQNVYTWDADNFDVYFFITLSTSWPVVTTSGLFI